MAEDWRAVGINAKVDSVTRSLFSERVAANRAQSWMFYDSALFPFSMYNPFSPGNVSYQGVLYTRWVNSGGAEGLEPPDDLKELIDIIDGRKVATLRRANGVRAEAIPHNTPTGCTQ